jgi:alpha-L-fucosidase
MDWFANDRFGLFIHWGLYSIAARHEWVQFRERIHPDEYAKFQEFFDPDLYDPVQWAQDAWQAGMRYVVLTTKHHEGFCLWDSDLTSFKADRDLVAEYVTAFRERGFKIGFYHSLIDWHHDEFPVDSNHPMRDDAAFRELTKHRDVTKYADYLHGQVRELLTRYGKIDVLWFDFSYPGPDGKGAKDWRSEELLALVRTLQPGILVNNRLELEGDFETPECFMPASALDGPWEACQTLNGSWGYDRDNHEWKSPELLIRMLIDGVSKGGNLLLNVGPTARGEFQPETRETLASIGTWMRLHGRSVYGAGASYFMAPPDCRYTQRGNRLYVHVFAWPQEYLHLPGLAGKLRHAQFLHDGSEVRVVEAMHSNLDPRRGLGTEVLTLRLPAVRPEVAVPVIELFL